MQRCSDVKDVQIFKNNIPQSVVDYIASKILE